MPGSSRHGPKTHYIYEPLNAANENLPEIRLVELMPAAHPEEPLRCQIRHEPLSPLVSDATPEAGPETRFEALSSVWGDDAPFDQIFLDGDDVYMEIGQNLSIALRCLRLANRTRILWIDALCINQTDLDEKNAQVTLMYKIYSQARDAVIFWNEPVLLPKNWNVKRAFAVARRFADFEEMHPQMVLRGPRGFEELAVVARLKSTGARAKSCGALRAFLGSAVVRKNVGGARGGLCPTCDNTVREARCLLA